MVGRLQLLRILLAGHKQREVHHPQEAEGRRVTHGDATRLQELCTPQAEVTQQGSLRGARAKAHWSPGRYLTWSGRSSCHLVWSLTTVCKGPAAISRRSPGAALVLRSSSSVVLGESSFLRGDVSVPSSLTCTRLTSCSETKRQRDKA